jgi:hypothetical protein
MCGGDQIQEAGKKEVGVVIGSPNAAVSSSDPASFQIWTGVLSPFPQGSL